MIENGFILQKRFSIPSRPILKCSFLTSDLEEPTFAMLDHLKRMPSFHRLLINWSFLHPKVGRAAATDLCWLSMYSYKKDWAQRGPLKACWLGAQWDKKHKLRVSVSHLPSPLCARLCCESCPGVVSCLEWMEGRKSSDKANYCFLLLLFIYFLHFYFPHSLSHLWLWRCVAGLGWISISRSIPFSKFCLINKPATSHYPPALILLRNSGVLFWGGG